MNKRFKKSLQAAFEAPPPREKEQFIRALHFPKTTYRKFLFSQMCYVRKRIWAASLLIVIVCWAVVFRAQDFINWNTETWKILNISAILPFLAMLTVAEIYRSAAYRMAELEVSCRFSLLQIITARLAILGGGNFAVLILLFIFLGQLSAYSILQVITYLMVPYLIVCGICLWILNHVRGQEGIYVCATAVGLVCLTIILFGNAAPGLYTNAHLNVWLSLFVFSVVFIAIEIRKLFKQMEEQIWNLLLTE